MCCISFKQKLDRPVHLHILTRATTAPHDGWACTFEGLFYANATGTIFLLADPFIYMHLKNVNKVTNRFNGVGANQNTCFKIFAL